MASANWSYHLLKRSANISLTLVLSMALNSISAKSSLKSPAALSMSASLLMKSSRIASKVVCVSCSLAFFCTSSSCSAPSMMLCRYLRTSSSIFAQNAGACSFRRLNWSLDRSNNPVSLSPNNLRAFCPSALLMSPQSSADICLMMRLPMEWEPADAPALRRSRPSSRHASVSLARMSVISFSARNASAP